MHLQFKFALSYSITILLTLLLCTFYLQQSGTNRKSQTTGLSNYLHVRAVNSRHVTKSLSELASTLNPYILFLNLIPKCGGEVLVLMLQRLQGWNGFKHVRLKQNLREKFLSEIQQKGMVRKVNDIFSEHAVPISFDRQMRFINFTSFGSQSPTFISIIREPLDIVLSRLKNATANSLPLCTPKLQDPCLDLDLPVSYLCGNDPKCREPNSLWALKTAQTNVERYYPVLGILEDFPTTLSVMQSKVPYFFKKPLKVYFDSVMERFNLKKKRNVSEDLKNYWRDRLRTEYIFYDWARNRLYSQFPD